MENIEYTYLYMDEYFPTQKVSKSSRPFSFPKRENIKIPAEFTHEGSVYESTNYLDSSYTQGLLVLQDNTLIYENYWRGQRADMRHISWSVAKSYISALFGIAIEEGHIKSIEQKAVIQFRITA